MTQTRKDTTLPTATKKPATNAGPNEEALRRQLAAIDADLLTDELRNAVTVRARAQDRQQAVQERRQAAEELLAAAAGDLSIEVDDLRACADDAAAWARVAGVVSVPVLDEEMVRRALMHASALLPTGGDLSLRQPAYLIERTAFEALPHQLVAGGQVLPPAITAAERDTIAGYRSALEQVESFRSALAITRQHLGDPNCTDVLNQLAAVGGYRQQRDQLAEMVSKTNTATEAADAERVALGLTWQPPSQN